MADPKGDEDDFKTLASCLKKANAYVITAAENFWLTPKPHMPHVCPCIGLQYHLQNTFEGRTWSNVGE